MGLPLDPLKKKQFTFSGVHILLAFAAIWFIQSYFFTEAKPKAVTYSEFLTSLREDKIQEILMSSTELVATLKLADEQQASKKRQRIIASRLPNIDEAALLKEIEDRKAIVIRHRCAQPLMVAHVGR
jgi:selenocysteine lyase/cysteine desulfurase